MSTTYGKDRAKIYQYLTTKGLEITPEMHEELKTLLIAYVNHQNANLKTEADAWVNHQKDCELFKARRQARQERKQKLKV